MGAKHSKTSNPRQRSTSTSSEARLAGYWPEKPLNSRILEPQVTRPIPPREITHLSNIIDPAEVSGDWTIRSPSGNLLGLGGYLNHPARPLSVRERQERVRRAIEEKKGLYVVSALATVAEDEIRKISVSGSESVVGSVSEAGVELAGGAEVRKRKRRFLCF